MRISIHRAAILLLIPLLAGCVKDDLSLDKIKEPAWEPELAVPLFHASLSLQDLLDKADQTGMVQVGNDRFCTIVFKGKLLTFSTEDFLNFPDHLHQEIYSLGQSDIEFLTLNNELDVAYPLAFPFISDNDKRLDSVRLRSGKIKIRITSGFRHNAELNTTFENIFFNGDPLQINSKLEYNNALPVLWEEQFDLQDAVITLDQLLATDEIKAEVAMHLKNSGNSATIHDQMKVEVFLTDLDFEAAYGYLGNHEFRGGADTIFLEIFKKTPGIGRFSLVDPELELVLNNSFGLPLDIQFLDLRALMINNQTHSITGPGVSTPIYIKSPLLSEAGQQIETRLIFNKHNSNLFNIVEKFPKEIVNDLRVVTNPQGQTNSNFVLRSSGINMEVNLRLPLYGRASDFILNDTIRLEITDVAEIKNIAFRTRVKNGFPVGFNLQMYFVDEDGDILDSLLDSEHFAPAAPTNAASGKVTVPAINVIDTEFDEHRLHRLPETRMILVKVTASTINEGSKDIRIYSEYDFGVELSASAGLKLKL
ncbi:MAG: hypothetical protein WD077_15975 [Bacteroidia bacterium]